MRYYGRRDTVRFDFIEPAELDRVVEDLTRAGRRPYILLDDTEVAVFRDRFARASRIGRLDWAPTLLGRDRGVLLVDPSRRR